MINVKELMIGDYVDVSGHGNPIEIGIVKEIYEIYGEGIEITIRLKDCDGIFAGNEISPIELTKEFFFENGFEEFHEFEVPHINETFSLLCNGDIKVAVIIIHGNHFRCEVKGIEIKYIHEFQHYLRLANLSDYANNLKI